MLSTIFIILMFAVVVDFFWLAIKLAWSVGKLILSFIFFSGRYDSSGNKWANYGSTDDSFDSWNHRVNLFHCKMRKNMLRRLKKPSFLFFV